MVRIKAEIAAAHWSARRLLQSSDEKDHHGAQTAATVKIWLIIMAIPLALFAAIVSNCFGAHSSTRCSESMPTSAN
jgi:hypothetical protein